MSERRLLVITNSFPDRDDRHIGGIFVKEQLRHIAPHFDAVHVIYPSTFGQGHKPREAFKDYSVGNMHVHFLSYVNVPLFLRAFRQGFTFLMARAIDKLVRREHIEFDLIHAHFTWPSGATAIRLKKKYKVPVVVTEHTSLTFDKAVRTKDPQFVDTWSEADAVIRVREGDIARMSALGIPEEKLHYVPNGFDGAKFRPMDKMECRKHLGIPLEGKVVVSVGGLDEVKGHTYLIDAMSRLVGERTDLHCYIVGKGPLMGELNDRVRSSTLEKHVTLVGPKPHDEIPYWIGSSDIVAHSSLSEGNPSILFETLGCGRPFIGTRVGGVPEIVGSEDMGLLCEPGNAVALADIMSRGLSKEWDSGKISARAPMYSWERISESVMAIYQRFLGATI